MKLSMNWLKDYVKEDFDPKAYSDKMTMTGSKVETIENMGENIKNVVTGKILSIDKHENADSLVVCQLDVGTEQLQIVTGAPNVKVGQVVPVALDGSTLPNNVHIKTGKSRGVESYGMLCSGEEMCLDANWYPGADVNGIMILDENAPLGMEMRDYLELDDYLFDISITANRPDCHSVIGIAKEIAAALKKPFKAPDMSYVEDGTVNENISIEVLDKELCPRYLGHYIYDVK